MLKNTIKSNSELFHFQTYLEDDLTWQQHNQIHAVLNFSYSGRTLSFTKKTYGHVIPVKRILCTSQGDLIGHIAVFEDSLLINNAKVPVIGLGLSASTRPTALIGAKLRHKALDICAEAGYNFAISRVRNRSRTKEHLAEFVWDFLDIPLVGKSTQSHNDEIVAIFNTQLNQERPNYFIQYFKKTGAVKIAGEIF